MGHLEHRARAPEKLRGRLRFWPALRFVGLGLHMPLTNHIIYHLRKEWRTPFREAL